MKCLKCKAPRVAGRSMCQYHLNWCRDNRAALRRRQKRYGLCSIPYCSERVYHFKMCAVHQDKYRKV